MGKKLSEEEAERIRILLGADEAIPIEGTAHALSIYQERQQKYRSKLDEPVIVEECTVVSKDEYLQEREDILPDFISTTKSVLQHLELLHKLLRGNEDVVVDEQFNLLLRGVAANGTSSLRLLENLELLQNKLFPDREKTAQEKFVDPKPST